MTSDKIRVALDEAATYLTEHRDEARYTDGPATAVIEDGLRARATGPGTEELTTDMPTSVGGGASAPSPGWFLRAAEATCTATLIAMRAAQLGVTLEGVEVTVDSQSDDFGILGLDPEVAAGPLSTRVSIRIRAQGPASREDLESIAAWAVEHCPVTDAVRRAIPMTVEVDTGD